MGRQTAGGENLSPLTSTSTYALGLTFPVGTDDYELTTSGLTALPDPEAATEVAGSIWAALSQSTRAGGQPGHDRDRAGKFVSINREGASFSAGNPLRARRYDPITGVEYGAWEYPFAYTNYNPPFLGMFSSNERFWWADFGNTSFRVFEDLAWEPADADWIWEWA